MAKRISVYYGDQLIGTLPMPHSDDLRRPLIEMALQTNPARFEQLSPISPVRARVLFETGYERTVDGKKQHALRLIGGSPYKLQFVSGWQSENR